MPEVTDPNILKAFSQPPPYQTIRGRVNPYKESSEQRAREDQQMQRERDQMQRERDFDARQRDAITKERDAIKLKGETARYDATGGVDGTEGENKSAALTTKLQGAMNNIKRVAKDEPGAEKPGFLEIAAGVFGEDAREFAQTEKRRDIAGSQFIAVDSALTLATGAAYMPVQIEGYTRSLFPTIADSPYNIAAKRRKFQEIIESGRQQAGAKAPSIDQALAAVDAIYGTDVPEEDGGNEAASDLPASINPGEVRRVLRDETGKIVGYVPVDGPDDGTNDVMLFDTQSDDERNTVMGAIDAGVRGIADVVTLGFADEIAAAGDTIFGGGTMDQNLSRQRGIDRQDERVNPYARISGQVAGGFALPGAGVSTVRGMAGVGAGYGGAYGFGTGEGTIGDRLVSAGTGAAIGGVVGAGVGSLANRLTGRGGPPSGGANQPLLDAAARQGIQTMPADSGGVAMRMASGMTNRTLGGIPMGNAAEASVLSARNARNVAAENIGQVSDSTGAGQAAQRGMRNFLETSEERGGQLFERVNIAPDSPAVVEGSRTALAEVTQGLSSNTRLTEMLDDPTLRGYLDAIDAEGLSFGDMRRFRSRIGEMIERPTVASERTSRRDLRRLYAGISEDLEATAAAEGPEALTAMRRANQYWRGRESRREGIVSDILGKKFDAGGREAFDQINRWAQNKGDFAKVARALRSMPADEANAVSATIVSRLGNAGSGAQNAAGDVFSPSTFVTNWRNLDDRAKMFLFRDRAHRAALDDIAEVTSGMKRAEQFSNTSKTGVAVSGLALSAGAVANLPLAILAAGAQYGAGMFLSRNATAVWLGKLAKYERQQTGRQSAGQTRQWLDRHIGQLSNIASRNPASADIIMELQRTASQTLSASPGRLAAEDGDK